MAHFAAISSFTSGEDPGSSPSLRRCPSNAGRTPPLGILERRHYPMPLWSHRRKLPAHRTSDDDISRLADEAEAGYVPSRLRPRGGRLRMGSARAEVVPVRLDPELRAAVETRASAEQTSTSEIIREALWRFLEVA
jgi:Ribbon-helix-helix protein, copG family